MWNAYARSRTESVLIVNKMEENRSRCFGRVDDGWILCSGSRVANGRGMKTEKEMAWTTVEGSG